MFMNKESCLSLAFIKFGKEGRCVWEVGREDLG